MIRKRSASAQAPKQSVPASPVAVRRTPAAALSAMPFAPRMAMTAVAPTAGPIGSWLRTTMAISTATASSTDAWTPIASSAIQLRAICAPTATRTSPTTRPRPVRVVA